MGNGRADAVVDWLCSHPSWQKPVSGQEAQLKARTGHFVIAGFKVKRAFRWTKQRAFRGKSQGDKSVGEKCGLSIC